jgi:hypothetical protein
MTKGRLMALALLATACGSAQPPAPALPSKTPPEAELDPQTGLSLMIEVAAGPLARAP